MVGRLLLRAMMLLSLLVAGDAMWTWMQCGPGCGEKVLEDVLYCWALHVPLNFGIVLLPLRFAFLLSDVGNNLPYRIVEEAKCWDWLWFLHMICCQDVKFEGAMMVWRKKARPVSGSRGQWHICLGSWIKALYTSGDWQDFFTLHSWWDLERVANVFSFSFFIGLNGIMIEFPIQSCYEG